MTRAEYMAKRYPPRRARPSISDAVILLLLFILLPGPTFWIGYLFARFLW